MLAVENNHMIILGQRGAGKTVFSQYLNSTFKCVGYNSVYTKISKNTTVYQFLQSVKYKTYMQSYPNNPNMKSELCSINGKKLIIFIDNFNLTQLESSLFEFFKTAISFGYYFDQRTNTKVSIGDICFICINNGSF